MNYKEIFDNCAKWDFVKERIFPKMYPVSDSNLVERLVGDIVIRPMILLDEEPGMLSAIKVSKDLPKHWGKSEEEVIKVALQNVGEPVIFNLAELTLDSDLQSCKKKLSDTKKIRSGYACLTNEKALNGAAVIFSDGVADRLCELMETDKLFLAFTSRHEVMVHDAYQIPVDDIRVILGDTVETACATEDFLTTSVYMYNKNTKDFSIAG